MNLKLMLEEAVRRYGDKTAIVMGDSRLSYTGLDKASNKMANALVKMGVVKGDRVAIIMANSPDFVITYFGITKIGAIAVLLDNYFLVGELASFFGDSQPKVLVTESSALQPLIPVISRFPSIKHIIEVGAEFGGQFRSYAEIMATGSARRIGREPEPEAVAHIVYSSGPSSHPRGAMMTHRCLVVETAIIKDGFQQTDKDVMMLYALPLHHMFALGASLLVSLYCGSTVVIVPGTGLSLASFMAAVEKEKGTIFLGVPYIFALAVDMAEKEGIKNDLSSLRLCVSAGASLPIDIIHSFKQRFGFTLADFWGLTEATCIVTGPPLDGSGSFGSVGKAQAEWAVKVVDDDGQEVPLNQEGELIAKGPMMEGYYNNPQATAEAIKDGWLYTGDIGRIDKDGYVFITGRKKPTIIVKGQNVYPEDIESLLLTHPKVAEVRVMAIPDKLRGEVVGAVVVLKEGAVTTEQEIRQFCLERLASYKAPKQVIFSNSLPQPVHR